jgi:sugar-specific transcriptional regulator TrmB
MRTIVASRLWSTNLAFAILHLLTLPLYHDCSVNQVLECREDMIHQLVLKRVNQASREMVLSLGVSVDIFKSIARQLQKPVSELTDRR